MAWASWELARQLPAVEASSAEALLPLAPRVLLDLASANYRRRQGWPSRGHAYASAALPPPLLLLPPQSQLEVGWIRIHRVRRRLPVLARRSRDPEAG